MAKAAEAQKAKQALAAEQKSSGMHSDTAKITKKE
jgi:hypothetical protein